MLQLHVNTRVSYLITHLSKTASAAVMNNKYTISDNNSTKYIRRPKRNACNEK